MEYDFLKLNSNNVFYPVPNEEIIEAERDLNIVFPKELKKMFLEIGYGFIKGSENNINRILDPYSIKDFRLRQNDFEYYPDIEIYEEFEVNKLIFFEISETSLVSISLEPSEMSTIYYYDTPIASSLKEFLSKIQKNDKYYLDLV